MIERAPPLALRQPEEAECAMSRIVLRLERSGTAEGFDRVLRTAERRQRDGAVVVSRDKGRIRPERFFETADGLPVTALGRDRDAEIVRDRGISRHDGQRPSISVLGFGEPPALKMGHGLGDKRTKFGRCLLHLLDQRSLLRRYLASGRTKNGKNFDFGTERATKCQAPPSIKCQVSSIGFS